MADRDGLKTTDGEFLDTFDLIRDGKYAEALPILARIVSLDPADHDAFEMWIDAHRQMERFERVIQLADEGIAAGRPRASLLVWKSLAYGGLDKPVEAERALPVSQRRQLSIRHHGVTCEAKPAGRSHMTRVSLIAVAVMTLALPLAAAQQPDSPLVAAAKRSGRMGKTPKHVITNEEVAASRGHLATEASSSAAQTAPTDAVADLMAMAAATTSSSAATQQPRPVVTSTPQPAAQDNGTARATYSSGQSSAVNATVNSTATGLDRPATAQNATVQSTAGSNQMDQTARTSNPPPVAPATSY
ncbi:MAG TPA: hypothetical protein VF980_13605 [Thermoanaerobaculia bacterium]